MYNVLIHACTMYMYMSIHVCIGKTHMKIIWKCTWAEFVHVDLEWLISYGNLITEILPVILQNEGTKVHNSQHSIHTLICHVLS